jgi:N-acetylglutamate synthase
MSVNRELLITLDQIAAATWPAESTGTVGNWLLRTSKGVTKRANSVLAIADYPTESDWLQKVEQFYMGLGMPAQFHVSTASPEGLDELLAAKGYEIDAPCFIMTANSEDVKNMAWNSLLNKKTEPVDIVWSEHADAMWIEAFMQLEKFPEDRNAFYTGLFERMPASKGFLQLKHNGHTVAVGTAITQNEWSGFVNVVVSEAYRGQGLGYVLMHALTVWSLEKGATKQYLQVVADNEPAVALYSKLGYQPLYSYHYRCKYDL